jgi:hypothetical protein
MKKLTSIISLLSSLMINQAFAVEQEIDFSSSNWSLIKPLQQQKIELESSQLTSRASKDEPFHVNFELLTHVLSKEEVTTLELPLPNGLFSTFILTPSSVMNSELAAKYPSIKTFTGYQIDKPEHQGNFDITPHGFHGVFTFENDKVFIDPISRNDRSTYHSYFRSDAEPLSLSALGKRLSPRKNPSLINKVIVSKNSNSQGSIKVNDIITYRIAVSTTAEYSIFHGGTKEGSLAALVTMLNRVNEVYQRDLAIKLELVANNDSIIFTDASTDPFTNTDEDLDLNTDVINTAIGADNYDIGHVVGTGGGGIAGFGVVCSGFKAEGLTGSDSPTNDAFYIDYVAHEIGHQFGAEHTFNGSLEACDGNREASSAYEPGSASTIMGYAGICGEQNLQNSSDPYFHSHSIEQITRFTQNGNGNSCGTKVSQTNQAPTVNAGSDFTIPARTPFTLKGQGIDSENDNLTYSWEQYDLGAISSNKNDDKTDDGTRPLFRAFAPNTSNERTFPVLSDILSGKQTHGEALPTTTRDLNFRLVVRDNQGNVNNDAMKVSVVTNLEGFSIIEPSIGASWQGEQQTVTWNTASTEQAPVSCNTVDILLSTDSGNTFSQVLANETPNDGSQIVNFSSINTETARIKIICNSNIFFAINLADISINSDGVNVDTKPVFSSQNVLNINEDNTLTLNKNALVFNDNLIIDSIAIVAGDNYQVEGLKIIPEENFNGELLITTIATQGQLSSDEFTVKVMVIAVNDVPVAFDESISFIEDSVSNSIDVLSNDTDIENDTLTIKAITYSGLGTAVIENNQIIYTPQSSFSGIETITYVINDGSNDSASATLTITVTAKIVVVPEPVPEPVPEVKKSSGGVAIYLLVLLLTAARRFKGGK